jgi:hypothetical protein
MASVFIEGPRCRAGQPERAVNEWADESNKLIAEANSAAIAYGLTIADRARPEPFRA